MCFSLLTVILLVVGRCGVADAAAPGCQTARATISDAPISFSRGTSHAPARANRDDMMVALSHTGAHPLT